MVFENAALPDFVLLGAQKSGTTSMFHLLSEHPDIEMPRKKKGYKKETHYFDENYNFGLSWYAAHFPDRSLLREGCVIGDATPCYIYNPLVPARLTDLLPNAKFIVILRDPIQRSLSHYFHCVRKGYETLAPEEAFDAEAERLTGELRRMTEDPSYYSVTFRRFSYVSRSLYAEQISNWLRYAPLSRFLFVRSDDFFRYPEREFARVCGFLGVNPIRIPQSPHLNIGTYSTEIHSSLIRRLEDRFHEPNRELVRVLGGEFNFNSPRSAAMERVSR